MKKYYSIIALVTIILIFSFLIFLPRENIEEARYQIGATIFPIYDITQNITGDTLEVGLILPPGASPHTFEPSPSLIKNFSETTVIYAVGEGFDDWINPIIEATGTEKQFVSSGVSLRETTEENHDTDENSRHGDIDPHYWLSIINAKTIASSITTNLSRRYPEHSETFKKNLQVYLEKLDNTEKTIDQQLSTLTNTNLVTLHDSYYYFAEEYGLNIVGTFEPTAGREPTPQYLIELTQGVESAEVSTIYSEPQLSSSGLKSFARDNNLTILQLDPIGGEGERDSFIDLMLYNASQIKKNN